MADMVTRTEPRPAPVEPVAETWRVVDHKAHTPAHLVVAFLNQDGQTVGWRIPRNVRGILIDRQTMIANRAFVCVRCARKAWARDRPA